MKELSYLIELGLDEVSSQTHITNEMLEAILEKRFQMLHPTKAAGFIKILQREYDIDFTEWNAEFQEYLKENKPQDDELFVYAKEPKKTKNIALGVVFVLFLLVVAFAFVVYSNNSSASQNDDSLSLVSKTIEEAKNNLQNRDVDFVTAPTTPQEQDAQEEQKVEQEKQEEKIESNVTQMLQEENENNATTTTDEVQSSEPLAVQTVEQEQESTSFAQDTNETIVYNSENFVLIPNGKIWIGLIDLEEYKKSQLTSEEMVEINDSKGYLILTGHGMFDLHYRDINKSYNTQYPVRFILENGTLQEIDKTTFQSLNKGSNW